MAGPPKQVDALIAGAGPAGSLAAIELARLGHRVLVVEQAAFPRAHVGTALPPPVHPMLERLGLWQSLCERGVLVPIPMDVLWDAQHQGEPQSQRPISYQADRGRFDAALLGLAVQDGARVCQPARMGDCRRMEAGGWQVLVSEPCGQDHLVLTRNLVLATGRAGGVAGRRAHLAPPTLALCRRWKGAAGRLSASMVTAGAESWCWAAPLPDGTLIGAVFVDPGGAIFQGRPSVADAFRAGAKPAAVLRDLDADLRAGPVFACDATRSISQADDPADLIRVGDAAFTIDPLSSQGVLHAMISGLHAAAAVHTMLTRPGSESIATAFVRNRRQEAVGRDAATAARFYRDRAEAFGTRFWARQIDSGEGGLDEPAPEALATASSACWRLNPAARFVQEPVLDGMTIVEQPALVHQAFDRPVAFLCGVPVQRLLGGFSECEMPDRDHLLREWGSQMPAETAAHLFQSLRSRNVLVPAV